MSGIHIFQRSNISRCLELRIGLGKIYVCIYVYLLYIYIIPLCVYIHTQIHTYRDFNELVQLIMRAGKHKIFRAVRQARNSCRISVLQS